MQYARDKLMSYNGKDITYDNIGNSIKYNSFMSGDTLPNIFPQWKKVRLIKWKRN